MFRILRSREDLTDDDLPLRVCGTPLCSRCMEVKRLLGEAGISFENNDVRPGERMYSGLSRHHASTLLAVFTRQDELLPAVIGNGWESCILQQDVERFLR